MEDEIYELSKNERNYYYYEVLKLRYPIFSEYIKSTEGDFSNVIHSNTKIIIENIYWVLDPESLAIYNFYGMKNKPYSFFPHRPGDTEIYGKAYGLYLFIKTDPFLEITMDIYKKNKDKSRDYLETEFIKYKSLVPVEGDKYIIGPNEYHSLSFPKLKKGIDIKDENKKKKMMDKKYKTHFFWCMAIFVGYD